MRELLDTEYQLTAHETVLNDLYQKLARNEEIVSTISLFVQATLFLQLA